jgi:hypothetical protein
MVYAFESLTEYKGFKALQRQINELTAALKSVGFSPAYFINKFGIDSEAFGLWLADLKDFAELVILYLPENIKKAIVDDINDLSTLISSH